MEVTGFRSIPPAIPYEQVQETVLVVVHPGGCNSGGHMQDTAVSTTAMLGP
jgi:hypothetical protein